MITGLQKTRQFSTFRINDLLLGIEVIKVQEVLRYQELTVIPLAPAVIEGLINLRGQIIIAIDTRRSLGLPRANSEALPMNVVIHSGDGIVSLLVDDIGDVIDVPLDAYSAVPDNMPAQQRDLIAGVYDLSEGLMLVLDTTRLLLNACN
jgi:purine-binding chemotaxis protein CheW